MATDGSKFLIIEGTTDDTNGNLREGFHKLLHQKLKGNMPRIKMGRNTKETIDKYRYCKKIHSCYALIDLDDFEINKQNIIEDHNLGESENVYFMIQEMEAWFISQPQILDEFYGICISNEITKKNAKEFPEPDKYLQELTRECKKGKYHKVRHGVELLKRLDADKLQKYFSDFDILIRKLQGS